MKRLWMMACTAALLAGCGSTVPLNEVPVADAKPTAVVPVPDPNGAGVRSGGVAPVDLGNTQAVSPSDSRIVYFDFDSYVIKPEYQSVIASHARFIKNQSERRVSIDGHTDEIGGREYNLALGQKRADAVRDALSILGVAQSQMESVSFGKEKPQTAGNDESAHSKNRRAEIRYQ